MLDYVGLEADLDAEERMIQETARSFVDDRVRPIVGDCFSAGEFPIDLIPEMGDLGFFGAGLDVDDLSGVSPTANGLLMQELEAGDSGLRSMVSVQGSLVMYPILEYGSTNQQERWIPPLSRGHAVGCFALTEPQHGSNPDGMTTHVEADGDGYVLNGRKTWITNAPIADVIVVWARDHSHADRPIRGFLIEPAWDGVSVDPIGNKLSMRMSATGEIGFDNVQVPETALLPGVMGLKGPLRCLTQARYGISWGAVGAARDCFETARQYASDRSQFGGPIARFQLQQEKLADMASGITTSQLLAYRLADLKARGDLRHQHVSMAKRHNVRRWREVARTAREMLGGNGITLEYSPMRHLANVETVHTYEGTDDIHTLVLGEDLTGIPAFE